MATGDDRRIIQTGGNDVGAINSALRQICEMIYKLEGRKGPIALRDQLSITSGTASALELIFGTSVYGQLSSYTDGAQANRLFLSRGAKRTGDDVWVAQHGTASIVELNESTLKFYFDSGLTVGAVYNPTQVTALSFTGLTVSTGDINANAVTYAKMQQVSAASRLLGRGSAAGAGNVEELTVSDLAISGTVLTSNVAGRVFSVYKDMFTVHANSGTGETDLTVTSGIPILSANDEFVEVNFRYVAAGNGNTKTIKLYIGTTATTLISAGTNGLQYLVRLTVARQSTTQVLLDWWMSPNDGGAVVRGATVVAEAPTASLALKTTGTGGATTDIQTVQFSMTHYK